MCRPVSGGGAVMRIAHVRNVHYAYDVDVRLGARPGGECFPGSGRATSQKT